MSVSEYLRMLEADTPGITRRIWESQGSTYSKASDVACAERLMEHIRIFRGERVEITPSQWSDHRQSLGIVAYHRQAKRPGLMAPEATPEQDAALDEALLVELTRLREAIEALTQMIEVRMPVRALPPANHQHSTLDTFSIFEQMVKEP